MGGICEGVWLSSYVFPLAVGVSFIMFRNYIKQQNQMHFEAAGDLGQYAFPCDFPI